ncbi:MAG: 2-oxoglutarate dehydrogenase E1 component, partial [Dokdonella sp.]
MSANPTSPNLFQRFQATSAIAGGNAAYLDDLYEAWLANPDAVEPAWRSYFGELQGRGARDASHLAAIARIEAAQRQPRTAPGALVAVADTAQSQKQAAVLKLVTAYRSRGHLAARLDPLELEQAFPESDLKAIGLLPRPGAPDLQPEYHGLDESDLDSQFSTGSLAGPARLKLRDLLARLRATYAGSIGAEFMHISDVEQRQWVHEQLERAGGDYGLTAADQRRVLEKLVQADGLERYLHTKYVGQKRFSLEGGDSLIPLLDEFVRRGGADGMRDMVIGMAHRGRLNVLVNILGKSPEKLFAEFD